MGIDQSGNYTAPIAINQLGIVQFIFAQFPDDLGKTAFLKDL
jgi:hypothetical protein